MGDAAQKARNNSTNVSQIESWPTQIEVPCMRDEFDFLLPAWLPMLYGCVCVLALCYSENIGLAFFVFPLR